MNIKHETHYRVTIHFSCTTLSLGRFCFLGAILSHINDSALFSSVLVHDQLVYTATSGEPSTVHVYEYSNNNWTKVQQSILEAFAGDVKRGIASPSVQKTLYEKACDWCGEYYWTPFPTRSQYCSTRCRMAAHRAKKN